MGTGPFAVPSFQALLEAGHDIACVVTRPQAAVKSRKGAPPSPVRDWAEAHQLKIFDPDSINSDQAIAELINLQPTLLVVCDYGQILKPAALQVAKLGGLNLHGSLLPRYRGAGPVQWAMLSGDQVTGVSVIHMTPRLDGGPILTTRSSRILDHETAGELEARLAILGVEATSEAVHQIASWDGHATLGTLQDPEQVTKAPRLRKADAEIQWDQPAGVIDCHVRGMQPWPVAFTHLPSPDGKSKIRLAIREIQILDDANDSFAAGEIVATDRFCVATADRMIEICRLQPAGKREMSGVEFLRGHKPAPGTSMI